MFLPEIGEQRAIASVLGALDDKFELNGDKRDVEAMARALFQNWFVTPPSGLPKGWRYAKVSEFVRHQFVTLNKART